MKSSFFPGPTSKANCYNPLKFYTQFNPQSKKHKQLIKRLAQPFIQHKSKCSQVAEINIAGYKVTSNTGCVKKGSGHEAKQDYVITKEAIQKYLFTFCFEIGCDLPTDQELKLIYNLILTHSKAMNSIEDQIQENMEQGQNMQNSNNTQKMGQSFIKKFNTQLVKKSYLQNSRKKNPDSIKKSSLYMLIRLCLQIYIKSKKSSIGGIIERLIIGIRKQIEIQDQQNQSMENIKGEMQ